jgi:hypothetical protein
MDPRVLELLSEHFVSCWNLVVDLDAFAADTSAPQLAGIAQSLLDAYQFPVMMMILDPRDGHPLHQMNANVFLDINSPEEDMYVILSPFML